MVICWNGPPTQNLETLFASNFFQDGFTYFPLSIRRGNKQHSHAIRARVREINIELRELGRQKLVWNLSKNTRAIAGVLFRAASSPVSQARKNSESVLDDAVRETPFEIGYEADTA